MILEECVLMAEITSNMKTLKDIFDNRDIFRIPEFQRNFVWGQEQVDTLFDDFSEDTNEYTTEIDDLSGYLLGNIVLIEGQDSNKEYDVIDGQQRLTTLSLLFCALRKCLLNVWQDTKNQKYERHAYELSQYFELIDDDYEFEGVKIIHNSTLDYHQTYEDIIKDLVSEEETPNSNNVLIVYNTILDKLEALAKREPETLIYLRKYLVTKVSLIVTIAPNMDKAFQLFEVLNDRGQQLEPMDLVKNFLLKVLNECGAPRNKIDEFVKKWNEYTKILVDNRVKHADFIKQFILAVKGQNINKNKVYKYFQEEFFGDSNKNQLVDQILKLATDLSSISKIYVTIEANAYSNDFLKLNHNMQMIFSLLKIKQMHPIFINFYDADKSIKEEVVESCLKYGAAVVFSFNQTNHIEKELPGVIKAIQEEQDFAGKLKVLKDKLSVLIKPYIDDLAVLLPTKNLGDSNGRRSSKGLQILKFVERYLCEHNEISFEKGECELEHIMPYDVKNINFSQYGCTDADEHVNYVNRIGNMALLTKPDNISASNKLFGEKVQYYETSKYIVTLTLAQEYKTKVQSGPHKNLHDRVNEYLHLFDNQPIDCWTTHQIDQRGQKITQFLVDSLKI